MQRARVLSLVLGEISRHLKKSEIIYILTGIIAFLLRFGLKCQERTIRQKKYNVSIK